MRSFSELGLKIDMIIGDKITIDNLFNKEVVIEKTIISPTKYPGRNSSGMRMQMQLYIPPEDKRYSCFTGSDSLINLIRQAEQKVDSLYPFKTKIIKQGRMFLFT